LRHYGDASPVPDGNGKDEKTPDESILTQGRSMKARHQTSDMSARAGRDTDQIQKEIVDWLRDAYGMERGLESALEKQSKNEEASAEIRRRASMHLEETRRHAEAVKSLLQTLGTDTSSLKTGMGMMAQSAKGMMTVFARDERIKDLLDSYMMEHFEIACYTALAAAAERAGLMQVVETCRSIIPDEERMAETIITALPDEVSDYLFEETVRR
jgi:ferritin-like metal-binding protein YciE